MVKCPVCETMNSEDAMFCKGCGVKMAVALEAARRVEQSFANSVQCHKCYEFNDLGAIICKGCGQPLPLRANQSSRAVVQIDLRQRKSSGCLPAVIASIIFFVLLSVFLSAIDSYQRIQSEAAAETKQTLSLDEKADTYPHGNYDDYARNPDKYSGFSVQIEGTVLQVVEGDEAKAYRIYTDEDYNQIWYVEYAPVEGEPRILENDTVTVYGEYCGICTYESVLGVSISCPAIAAENIIIK